MMRAGGKNKMDVLGPRIPNGISFETEFIAAASNSIADEKPLLKFGVRGVRASGSDFYRLEMRESVFERCAFVGCNFSKSGFLDVAFKNCDFSGSFFTDGYFERCSFDACKCVGTDFSEIVCKHVAVMHSNFSCANLDGSKWIHTRFEQTDLTESGISQVKLQSFEAVHCRFIKNNFTKTPLKGLDFTNNELAAPIVSVPPDELRGLKISMDQAMELVGLLGVIIEG